MSDVAYAQFDEARDDPLERSRDDSPVAASGGGGGSSAQTRLDALRDRENAALDRLEKSQERESQIAEEKSAALAPIRERMMEASRQPLPDAPQPQAPPPVPKHDRHDDENWLFAASLLGALGGGLSRRHVTNALGAFQGAMEGYAQGSRQKFDQDMKTWEAENKRIIEINKSAQAKYLEIMSNRKLTQEQMSVELQMAAMPFDDQAMITAAKSKNSLVIAQLVDKHAQNLEKLEKSHGSLAEQRKTAEITEMQRLATEEANSEQGIRKARAIMLGLEKMPGTPRTGYAGFYDRAVMDNVRRMSLEERGVPYDARAFGVGDIQQKTAPLIQRQKDMIPVREETAGRTSAARTAGVAGTNIELASRTAGPVIEMASVAAGTMPLTAFKQLNWIMQTALEEIGDPQLRTFKLVNMELEKVLARVLNPRSSVITVTDSEHARQQISTADSPEAYTALLLQIKQLTEREFRVVKEQQRGEPIAPIHVETGRRSSSVPEVKEDFGRRVGRTMEQAVPGSMDHGEFQPRSVLPEWLQTPEWLRNKIYTPPSQRPPTHPPGREGALELPDGWKVREVP